MSVTDDEIHDLEMELRHARMERDEARAESVSLRAREVCGPACDTRYHELRSILGAGQTETIADAARRVMAERQVLAAALSGGDQPHEQLTAIATLLGSTDTTNLADRVRSRLAGLETQSEHVITESARRMFEAYLAFPDVDIDAESYRARDLVRYFLNMARVFAETETQERARRAERRQS